MMWGRSPLSIAAWLLCVAAVRSMNEIWVEVRAPRFVVHRQSAALRCDTNAPHEHIYKVVFYKHSARMVQFVRGRDPPYLIYNTTGAEIDTESLTPTTLKLLRMELSASGSYACEVALETPLYSKVSKPHDITVMIRQKHRPRIKIKSRKIMSTGLLEAACVSAPAHPAPHLTWFINNIRVDERHTSPHGSSRRHQHGLPVAVTSSSLHYPLAGLQLKPNSSLDVACLSTIPGYLPSIADGYADIQNNTVAVNVVQIEPAPTQLPVKTDDYVTDGARIASPRVLQLLLVLWLCI